MSVLVGLTYEIVQLWRLCIVEQRVLDIGEVSETLI